VAISGIQPEGLKINYSDQELKYLKDIHQVRYR
jgi:hypothetical protein